MRLGIAHKLSGTQKNNIDPQLILGSAHPFDKDEEEWHEVRFERYTKLPLELRLKKEKLD